MKKLALALALASLPACAQDFEAGVFLGQNTYKSQTILGTELKPETKTVAAARLGFSIVDLGPALFEFTVGYQPKAKTAMDANGANTGLDYGDQYWSAGLMFNFKAFVAVGAGVEYRGEKLTLEGPGLNQSTNYGRPWARVNVGFSFPLPIVKPFVGVEAAMPLASTSAPANYGYGPGADTDASLKSHAPSFQVGVYGGIRF
ncbi:MAG TPA: hypothetical protein VFM84_01525 [Holophagaceae bacterium]|nr:hypothetical protein [Holophagaceae bacterium]